MRYANTNNEYLKDYDPSLGSTFLSYWDANKLHEWVMSQFLPYGEFEWLISGEIETLDVPQVVDDSLRGYILEVDVEYSKLLNDHHNDLPLSAQEMIPPESGSRDIKTNTKLM